MMSIPISQQLLRNYMMSRIFSGLFSRVKSTEACNPIEETSSNDMPTLDENPFKKERRLCILCKLNIEPDYKNVRLLSQFQSRYTGRIYGKHITGLCKHKQTRVEQEIMKAQTAGLMGYMTKDTKYMDDPKLFDPNFPFRSHKY